MEAVRITPDGFFHAQKGGEKKKLIIIYFIIMNKMLQIFRAIHE